MEKKIDKKKIKEKRDRDKRITVRTTEDEYEKIKAKAESLNISLNEYIIKSTQENKIILIDCLSDFVIEMKNKGNNLNQALKLANELKELDIVKQLKDIQHLDLEILKKIESLKNSNDNKRGEKVGNN